MPDAIPCLPMKMPVQVPLFIRNYAYPLLFIAVLIYLALAAYDLKLPGANYDEMLYQAPAINFLADTVRTEAMQINPSVISVFGHPLPLMIMTYIGSIKTIWHIFFFMVAGISVETARLGSIVLGMMVLIYTFLFVRAIFNSRTALITVGFMAVSAEYVFYTSRDMTIVFMMLAKMGALYHLILYRRETKLLHLSVAGLWLGLGLYDKASFLWFILALIVYILIFDRKRFLTIPLNHHLTGIAWFVAGSLVFLVFNLIRLGETFQPMITDFTHTSGGINNMDILNNLIVRLKQFYSLLGGQGIFHLYTGEYPSSVMFDLSSAVISASLFSAIILSFHPQVSVYRSKLFFIIFFILFPLIQTVFTPTSLTLHHVAIVWPFHIILLAIFCSLIIPDLLVRSRILKNVSYFLMIILAGLQIFSVFYMYDHLKNHGSDGNWSEAIYELNDYLMENHKPVYLMTWGFTNNLIVTSRGQLELKRVYRDLMKASDSDKEMIIRQICKPKAWYLFSLYQSEQEENYRRLLNQCNSNQWKLHCVKQFFQKNGKEVYRIYEVTDESRLFEVSTGFNNGIKGI